MVDQLFGMWDIDGRAYDRPGILHVDHERKTLLLKIDIFGEDVEAPDPYEDENRFYIRGKLTDGKCITLYRCRLCLRSASINPYSPKRIFRYEVAATYAFMALEVESENDLFFKSVFLDLGEIGEWAELSAVEQVGRDETQGKFVWRWIEGRQVEVCFRDGLTVHFMPSISTGLPYNKQSIVRIRQPVVVQFYYQKPVSWEQIVDDIHFLLEMIEFQTRRHVGVARLQYSHYLLAPKPYRNPRCNYVGRKEEVLVGDGDTTCTEEIGWSDYVLKLREWGGLFVADGVKCQNKFSDLRAVLKLFLDSTLDRVSKGSSGAFCRLTQALEAYHRFRCERDGISGADCLAGIVEIYKKDKILKREKDETQFRHWLCRKTNLGKDETPTYKMRFFELVYPMREKVENFPRGVSFLEYIEKLSESRNYYTHYDQRLRDKAYRADELANANEVLAAIVRFYLLREMGVSSELAEKRMGMDATELVRLIHNEVEVGEQHWYSGH